MADAGVVREPMSYRYSYTQSRMDPPQFIVKDGWRHIAECWSEADAQRIVRALHQDSPNG